MRKQLKEKKPSQTKKPAPKRKRYSKELMIDGNRIYVSVGKRRGKQTGHANGHELLPASNDSVLSSEMRALARSLLEEISSRKSHTTASRPTRLLEESTPAIIDVEEVPTFPKMQEMQVGPGMKNSETIEILWGKFGNINDNVLYLISFKNPNGHHCIKQIETYNNYLVVRINRFNSGYFGTEVKIEVTAGILPPGESDHPSKRTWEKICSHDYLLPKPVIVETNKEVWDIRGGKRRFKVGDLFLVLAFLGVFAVIFVFVKFPHVLGLK